MWILDECEEQNLFRQPTQSARIFEDVGWLKSCTKEILDVAWLWNNRRWKQVSTQKSHSDKLNNYNELVFSSSRYRSRSFLKLFLFSWRSESKMKRILCKFQTSWELSMTGIFQKSLRHEQVTTAGKETRRTILILIYH